MSDDGRVVVSIEARERGTAAAAEQVAAGLGRISGAAKISQADIARLGPAAQAQIAALAGIGNAASAVSAPLAAAGAAGRAAGAEIAAGMDMAAAATKAESVSRTLLTAGGAPITQRTGGLASAIISQATVSAVANQFGEVQRLGERAAHGIETAMTGAFVAPAAINRLASFWQEQQSLAARAAKGIQVAFDAAFVGPAALKAAQSGVSAMTEAAKAARAPLAEAGAAGAAAGTQIATGMGLGAVAMRNTGSEVRELTYILDELIGGRINRIPGSLAVLANRAGLMQAAFTALISPIGAGVAGLAALAAAGGYLAYEFVEDRKNIEEVQGSLALMGQAFATSGADIEQWRTQFKSAFDTSQSDARATVAALGAIPHAAMDTEKALGEIARTISQASGSDYSKTLAEVEKAARGGASGIAGLTKTLGIDLNPEALAAAESMQKAGASTDGLASAVGLLQAKIGDTTAWAKQTAAVNEYDRAVEYASVAGEALALGGAFGERPDQPPRAPISAQPSRDQTPLAIEAQQIGTKAVPQDAERIGLQTALNTLKAREVELNRELAEPRVGEHGTENRGAEQRELNQNLAAQAEKERELAELHTRVEKEAEQATQERLSAQQAAYRSDAEVALKFEQEKYAAALKYAEAPIRRAHPELSDEAIRSQAEQLPEVQREQRALVAAAQPAARQRVELNIEAQREIANNDQKGGAERVAAQRQILALMQANEQQFGPVAIAQQRAVIATVERQNQQQQYQEFKAGAELRIQEAKNEVDKIIAIYSELKIRAAGPGAPAGEPDRVAKEETAALQNAQVQQFRSTEENLTAQNRIADMSLAAQKAQLATGVAAHSAAKDQELATEANLTSQVMAQEEQRTAVALQANDLTLEQRQKLNEQLAELYAKDAETQAQYQKQITAAIDEENKKRAQTFTSFFDSTGDALEKFVTAGLTRSETMAKAARSLATSLIGDAVKGITGEGSKLLGSGLAGITGVKAPEGAGLGQVLGLSVEKALGLYKEPDKTAQEKISEALTKENAALDTANKNLAEIVKNTAKGQAEAREAPTGTAAGGAGAVAPGGALTQPGAAGVMGVPGSDPRGMEPTIREAATKYGIDPDVAVRVARSEGLGTFAGDKGTSFGAFQLHTGGGMGDEFQAQTGLDPSDPKNEPATIDYAMANVGRTGWTPYHGAARVGIGPREGIGPAPSDASMPTGDAAREHLIPPSASIAPEYAEADALAAQGAEPTPGQYYATPTQLAAAHKIARSYDDPSPAPSAPQSSLPSVTAVPAPSAGAPDLSPEGIQPNLPAAPPMAAEYGAGAPQPSLPAPVPATAPAASPAPAPDPQLVSGLAQLNATQQQGITATQSAITEATSDAQQSQQLVGSIGQDKTSTDALKASVDKETTATTAAAQKTGSAASGGTTASAGTSSLALLTQGIGIASSAAAVFGRQLSTGTREILGAVGVVSQLASFGKNLSTTLGLADTATKTATVATTLDTSAKTVTTAATTTMGTAAVTAGAEFATAGASAAAGGAASSAGGIFGAIGGAIKAIPLIGGLFSSGGGIVPQRLSAGGIVYAANGWGIPSGTDTVPAMLTPGERVLTVDQTRALAGISISPSRTSLSGIGPAANSNIANSSSSSVTSNSGGNHTFNYAPSMSGRFGGMSSSEVSNVLRSHGGQFEGYARNAIRNGFRG